ncbi:MAG: class I SAM-dependent methyltransferase [Phenylobacterium sp.]
MSDRPDSIAYYETQAEEFFARTVGVDMSAARAGFIARLPPGARVLDAGCGAGRDAAAFRALGYQVTATEAAPSLAALASRHIGLPVEVKTFDQFEWREAFDGVWACASLLHLPRAELPAMVARLRAALVPGGVLWMSFRHGAEDRIENERLFVDLDEAGAAALLEAAGGLDLLELSLSEDSRPDRQAFRWLSITARRAAA